MRRPGWFVLLVLALLPASLARAQLPPLPPAIVTFAVDRVTITLAEAEAGDQTATFTWQVVNLADAHRLRLERQELTGWVSELYEDERLPPAGTRPVLVKPPLNFGAPSYRLSIVDETGNLLDAQHITIPYEIPPEAQPRIEGFSSAVTSLYRGDLKQGRARLNVAWTVRDRVPTSNLVFEQLLADDNAVSVELPRGNLWIASAGGGVVAPVLPAGDDRVRLRLRLVDVLSGKIYDSVELELAISDTPPTPIATVTPTTAPSATSLPPSSDFPTQIIRFTATPSPADPAGLVTLAWTVRGAASISLEWMARDGSEVTTDGLPLEGTFNLRLSEIHFSGTQTSPVRLIPKDAAGNWINGPDQTIIASDLWIPLTTNLRVESFTASPNPVERGGTITFSWKVANAAEVRITRINPQGILTMDEALQQPLPASGTISVPVPEGYSTNIAYLLGATDANGVSISGEAVDVKLVCPFEQFIAPSCPLLQKSINAAYQTFQNGAMVWREDAKEILVLYADQTYEVFQDMWTPGETIVTDTPPDGLIAPARGFGKVWANNPDVRNKLGWATAAEASYRMTLETVPSGFGSHPTTNIYFTLPDGRRVHQTGFPRRWDTQP
ncbi:MAG: hypothetical protein HZC41_11615 [Chloroflexi bacterium]|nr:hypothetical protein [Chloroflexota bacterium]